jgi:multidrug efflux pump subunit AcrA (membrane-fusion protein)
MFGKVMLKGMEKEKRIIIPASAIAGSAILPQVYLIKNGKAGLHNIGVSRRIGNQAIVSEGLLEGDIIVTGGFINLFDGANVVVKN